MEPTIASINLINMFSNMGAMKQTFTCVREYVTTFVVLGDLPQVTSLVTIRTHPFWRPSVLCVTLMSSTTMLWLGMPSFTPVPWWKNIRHVLQVWLGSNLLIYFLPLLHMIPCAPQSFVLFYCTSLIKVGAPLLLGIEYHTWTFLCPHLICFILPSCHLDVLSRSTCFSKTTMLWG